MYHTCIIESIITLDMLTASLGPLCISLNNLRFAQRPILIPDPESLSKNDSKDDNRQNDGKY